MSLSEPAPAYKESLLVEDGQQAPRQCRRRCKNKDTRLPLVIGVSLLLMAVLFVGGWFAGRRYEHDDDHHQHHNKDDDKSSYNNEMRISQTPDQTSTDKPVVVGSVPVYNFVQCNYADGNLCQSANPILTPKATIQLTLYQFNGQTSFIVTSTGENYGEASNATRARRSASQYQNTMTLSGCRGSLFMPNKDKQMSKPLATSTTSGSQDFPFSYASDSSHTHIINLDGQIPSDGCSLSFNNAPSGHGFTIRGGDDILTTDSDAIPVSPNKVNIKDITSMVPAFKDTPVDMKQFVADDLAPAFTDASDFFMAPLGSSGRKKRSFFSDALHDAATAFRLIDPVVKAVQSTIKVIHDIKHGGTTGSITYDITNHTSQCRSRFTMLYHDVLNDASGIAANASSVRTYLYRHENGAGIRNLSMWQTITPLVNEAASSAVSLVGQIPKDLPCFTSELNEVKGRVKTFLDSLKSGSARRKRGLSWNCGLLDSVEQGYDCGKGAFDCGSDIAEGDVTFGLSFFKAAKDCYDGGSSCYHLVRNCVGGL